MFISINICHWLSTNIFFSPSYVIIYHQAKHNPYHWWLCTLTTCKIPDNSYKTSKKYQSLSHGVGERYQRIEYWRYKTYLKVTRLTEGWCNVNIVPDTRIATLKPNDHLCTIYLPNPYMYHILAQYTFNYWCYYWQNHLQMLFSHGLGSGVYKSSHETRWSWVYIADLNLYQSIDISSHLSLASKFQDPGMRKISILNLIQIFYIKHNF